MVKRSKKGSSRLDFLKKLCYIIGYLRLHLLEISDCDQKADYNLILHFGIANPGYNLRRRK